MLHLKILYKKRVEWTEILTIFIASILIVWIYFKIYCMYQTEWSLWRSIIEPKIYLWKTNKLSIINKYVLNFVILQPLIGRKSELCTEQIHFSLNQLVRVGSSFDTGQTGNCCLLNAMYWYQDMWHNTRTVDLQPKL
jgi:hypothetical protein